MPFSHMLARFCQDEDGAVTIDWVVLTSACLGLGMAVIAAMPDATGSAAGSVSDHLEEAGASSGPGTAPGRTATTDGG